MRINTVRIRFIVYLTNLYYFTSSMSSSCFMEPSPSTSSIFSKITHIKEYKVFQNIGAVLDGSILHNYRVGFDNERRIIYIEATIRPDILDKGAEPDVHGKGKVKLAGTFPGDVFGQFIGQKLGGSGFDHNSFPINGQLDTTKWKVDEDAVYNFLKEGENRHADVIYGVEYTENEEYTREWRRPLRIHYHFQLFKDGEKQVPAIEGTFENTSPLKTKQ